VIDFSAPDTLLAKPYLTEDISVCVHLIRGREWAVVQNHTSGQFLRVHASLWQLVTQLQGQQTLQDWLTCNEEHYEPDELLSTLVTLLRSGIVVLPQQREAVLSNGVEGINGGSALSAHRWLNPLMIRIALIDPNRLLGWLNQKSQGVTLTIVALISVLIVSLALVAGILNSADIGVQWQRSLQSVTHWWTYLLVYPLLKLVHEFAHGMVLRRLGGEVHEAGISLLVFMPLPYVDATDSWRIGNRYHRMLVTGAGMWAEGLLAAIGLLGFCLVQPGLFRELLFAVFVLGSVSTIFFNANPLLKFDGYYLAEDALQIPGLARRSQLYYRYLYKRFVLRIDALSSPIAANGETVWLLVYGVLSTLYRCFISLVIAVFLVNTLHEVGVLLAVLLLFTCFVRPVLKWIRYLLTSSELNNYRLRSLLSNCALTSLLITLVFALPLPSSTRAEGIVWVPEQAELFAAEDGAIDHWKADEGDWLEVGQTVLRLDSPQLIFEQKAIDAEVKIKQLEYDSLKLSNPNHAKKALSELNSLKGRRAHMDQRVESLDIKARTAGRLAKTEEVLEPGYHVKQGQLAAFIVNPQSLIVRAVVDQQQLGRVKTGISNISVRLAHSFANKVPARLKMLTPTGDHELPSLALADIGYGGISMDSDEALGIRTSEQVFHLELELLDDTYSSGIGGLAYINLQHASETLATRWWRSSRQLMLKHLPV